MQKGNESLIRSGVHLLKEDGCFVLSYPDVPPTDMNSKLVHNDNNITVRNQWEINVPNPPSHPQT